LILGRDINFCLYFLLSTLLSCLFVYLNLSEFIQVGVLNNTEGYPFGGEGPTPWNYKKKELYFTVTFLFSLLFSTALFFTLWTFIKNKKAGFFITLMLTLFLIFIQLITGQSF
jgi:hypothetical protein